MELNQGYALIKTDEYIELMEIKFHQEEIILENKELKKQVKDLKLQLLESNIVDSRLRNGKMEEVTDPKDYYFPYDKDFLEKLNVPIKDVIEFIILKKTALLEEEEKANV